jgi:Domain of unknown function (DUF1707)/Domain of unknown function (DUF4190)
VSESPELRASDADRFRVEAALREGYAEGRLSLDELDARLERAGAAATLGELDAVLGDLARPARPPAPVPAGRDGRATASLVLGAGSLVLPLLPFAAPLAAIILGVLARRDLVRRPGRSGRGMAEAGIALGALALLIHVVLLVVLLAGGFG